MPIKTVEELIPIIEKLKKENKTVVTINGSFDILHKGHIHILEQAKAQGDVLIVGLNSDSSIKQYKGPTRPIKDQETRARILSSLDPVDYVLIFNETTPINFLEKLKPHVHANGSEYGKDCIEAPTVKKHGGRIHIINRIPDHSSTNIIDRMKDE
ncbi:MAG: adenylyltransferase/cytidyltransferase family protein [Nanoarchaeota archaeon]|nr:adenylyltransferase/cytidyltransferase family protein [Nanoarchaeota archaeon]